MSTIPTGKIFAAICAVMKDIDFIGKDRSNDFQRYKFRGIDDCYNAVHGPLTKHGVFIVPTVLERDFREYEKTGDKAGGMLFYTTLKVSHKFYAEDGSYVEAVTYGEAMDSGDKSTNKAMSAAMKYAILEVFAIPTEGDNDTENSSPAPAKRANAPTPPKATNTPPAAQKPSQTPPDAGKPPLPPGMKTGDSLDITITEIVTGLSSKDKVGKEKVNAAGQKMAGKPYTQWGFKSEQANCTLTTIKSDLGNELEIAQEDEYPRRITYEPNQYGGNIKSIERAEG